MVLKRVKTEQNIKWLPSQLSSQSCQKVQFDLIYHHCIGNTRAPAKEILKRKNVYKTKTKDRTRYKRQELWKLDQIYKKNRGLAVFVTYKITRFFLESAVNSQDKFHNILERFYCFSYGNSSGCEFLSKKSRITLLVVDSNQK